MNFRQELMIRFNKGMIYVTAIVLGAWLLPWLFRFVAAQPVSLPFTLYSCVTHRFAWIDRSSGENIYRDEQGMIYTERQFDSILPTFYYRQLMTDGRLPAMIGGRPVDARSIQQGNFIFRHIPSSVNVKRVPLYALMEGMSGRVDLSMPADVFRMNGRMEFVDMKTNRINEEKSERFTRALSDKGFEFPVRYVAGNPTTRKEYDEGYLLVDAGYRVFHVKRLLDRPFVRNTGIDPDLKIKYAFVMEFRNRRFYGLLTDAANRLYVLEAKTYRLCRLPLEHFDPERQSLTIFGDDFYWTLQVTGEKGVEYYAVNATDYSLAARKYVGLPTGKTEWVGQYLFPFELTFTSTGDKYVFGRIGRFSLYAFFLNFIIAVGYAWWQKRNSGRNILPVLLLFLFGLFALGPVIFLEQGRHRGTGPVCAKSERVKRGEVESY